MSLLVSVRHVGAHPGGLHQHGVSAQISVNLGNSRLGAYSRWVLIRGWGLIQIDTVLVSLMILFGLRDFPFFLLAFFYDNIIANNLVYIHCTLEQLRPEKVL